LGTDLILYSVPLDAKVFFMRNKTSNSGLVADYSSTVKSLPYALRNRQNGSIYRIQSTTADVFKLATVNVASCQSGVLIHGGESFNATFGTNQLPPFSLTANMKKCVIITNTCFSVVTFRLQLIPQADFVFVHAGRRRVANFTGWGTYGLVKNGTEPLLVIMSLPPEVLSTREVSIEVNAGDGCNEMSRSVYLGPREILKPVSGSDLDDGDLGVVPDAQELTYLIALPIIAVCLIGVFGVSCVRYKWSTSFGEKMTQGETQSTGPHVSARGTGQRTPLLAQEKSPF
jgi:hypothetical protein